MMAASAISGICSLAPATLPHHRDREARKPGVCDHDVLLNRMLKHSRSFESTPELVHHSEQPAMELNHRSCSCGMESTSSQSTSTSGQGRLAMPRKSQKKLSMKKVGRKPAIRSCDFEKAGKEVHQRQQEKWGMDMHGDVTEEVSRRQKRRAALAALAVAGYVSILQPSSASAAEAFRVDFPAPTTGSPRSRHLPRVGRQEPLRWTPPPRRRSNSPAPGWSSPASPRLPRSIARNGR